MIEERWKVFLCSLVAVCLSPVCVTGQESRLGRNLKSGMSYCELAEQPEKYNHRIFLIDAIYRSGGEIMSFYDPACPSRELTSWVDYSDGLRRATPSEIMAEMNRLLKENGRARITVRLEFYGPKPVRIPPGTSSALADLMRGTNSRWGHQNQFATRVRFLKILAAEPVSPNVAWPDKPTENYGTQRAPTTDTRAHETGHADPPKPQ